MKKCHDLHGLDGRVQVGAIPACLLPPADDIGDYRHGIPVPAEKTIVQWSIWIEVFGLENCEHADQIGRPLVSLRDPVQLLDDVAFQIRVRQVVGVAGVEHGVQQLLFGLEVMQQAGRGHASFLSDLAERGAAPSVTSHQTLGHSQDALPPVLSLGEQRGISPLIGHEAPSNQPTERTLDWLGSRLQGETATKFSGPQG